MVVERRINFKYMQQRAEKCVERRVFDEITIQNKQYNQLYNITDCENHKKTDGAFSPSDCTFKCPRFIKYIAANQTNSISSHIGYDGLKPSPFRHHPDNEKCEQGIDNAYDTKFKSLFEYFYSH